MWPDEDWYWVNLVNFSVQKLFLLEKNWLIYLIPTCLLLPGDYPFVGQMSWKSRYIYIRFYYHNTIPVD